MNAESASQLIPNQANGPGKQRLLAAGFLSAVVPGAGQLLAGRKIKGLVCLFLFSILLLFYWPVRLPAHFAGLIALIFAMIALCIFAATDAPYRRKPGWERPSQWWLAALLPMAFLAAVAHCNWLLRSAGFRLFSIPSAAMERTIHQDEHFIIDLRYYRQRAVAHGDLVAFTLANEPGITFLKRTIALPGDTVRGIHGRIWLNDVELNEPYVTRVGDPAMPELDYFGPVTIPPGKLFVLGDNRNNSRDSRMRDFGLVDLTDVMGRPLYIVPGLRGGSPRTLK